MPGDSDPPLEGTDYIFKDGLPGWLPAPVQAWASDLTYREVHAMELGVIGFLAGAGLHVGLKGTVGAFTVVVVALAFGLRSPPQGEGAVAGRIIAREPWYFLLVYTLTAAISVWTLPVILP